jgi:hypothetical protein
MFKSIETDFLQWIEKLEEGIQGLLYEKSSNWFEQKFELTDIESLFISPLKIFKSGKYYLLRAFLKDSLKVFRDKNDGFGLTYMDITQENNIVSLLEFKGIKYSSKDFQFDTEIKQIMILSDPYENNCFIKVKNQTQDSQDSKSPLGKKMIENAAVDINEIVENIIKNPNIIDTGTKLKEITVEGLEMEDSNIILATTDDFYKIYQEAKQEAKEAKKRAIEAHLKMDEIKKKYNIESESEESEEE